MPLPTLPSAYRPHVGEDFTLHHPTANHSLTLKGVNVTGDNGVQLRFSLLFDCASARIAQGSYTLSHPQLGQFDLFLVPTQLKHDGPVLYQAVFNLLKDEQQ